MGQYYYCVDIKEKKQYYLGKKNEIRHYLPLIAYIFKNKEILIYGDYCDSIAEKYKDYEEIYFETVRDKVEVSKDLYYVEVPPIEFLKIWDKIYCKVINNLEEHIPYKYEDIPDDTDW